jgi:hypothetical protein
MTTMITVRKLGVIGMVLLTLMVTACTRTAITPAKGVVTGQVLACSLVRQIEVPLYSGRTLVALEKVRPNGNYRFSVAPGSYQITGWWGSTTVTVRAAHTLIFNFPGYCQ